jgi:tetratricopeptide (TPR) repeat protein
MDAIVSGSAGVAVLLDGDKVASIHTEEPEMVVDRSAADIHLLLGENNNVEVIEDVCKDEVVEHLKFTRDRELALQLFLILLDSELSTSVREEAAAALEDFIGNRYVREQIECVLFAHELPKGIAVDVAFDCCESTNAKLTAGFLRRLLEHQSYIVAVRRQWDAIPEANFSNAVERNYIRSILVKEGCFRRLVEDISFGKSADEFLIESMLQPLIKVLPNNRDILLKWTEVFRSGKLPQPFKQGKSDILEPKISSRRGETKHFSGDREKILSKVERQKEQIYVAMRSHNMRLVHKYTSDLIKYQTGHGGANFACKSLCDLAMKAKELYMHNLQLNLAEQSIEVKPDDGWAWTQYADALLCIGRPEEALKAYKEADRFGQYLISQKGRGNVLRTLGRLEEALAVYDKVIAENPYDVFAQNSRAEVLKAMNRLDEALAAYDKTIAENPYDVVTQHGRAEVLKAMNRLDEALAAYDKIITENPYNVVAQNGRAEVLKALNRLDEALAAYDKAIAENPYDIVAQTGRAEVLKAMNRLDEALAAYDKTIAENPYNVVAQHGRAEVLKAMNRLDEALAAYDKTIAENPYGVVAQNGRACVLSAMEKWDQALKFLPEKDPVTEDDWVGYHIRGMVLLCKDEVDRAIEIFEEGMNRNPRPGQRDYFRTALAVARLKKREYELASKVLEQVTAPILQTASAILKLHAFGRQGDCERAAEIYKTLPSKPGPILFELQSELHRQYVAYDTPRYNEEWLIKKEIQYLLLAA